MRKVHNRVTPPGLELTLLKKLPGVALAGTMAPLFAALIARLTIDGNASFDAAKQIRSIDIFLIAATATFWTAIFTFGIGCLVVYIMKGPSYAADSYELSNAERPQPRDEE